MRSYVMRICISGLKKKGERGEGRKYYIDIQGDYDEEG